MEQSLPPTVTTIVLPRWSMRFGGQVQILSPYRSHCPPPLSMAALTRSIVCTRFYPWTISFQCYIVWAARSMPCLRQTQLSVPQHSDGEPWAFSPLRQRYVLSGEVLTWVDPKTLGNRLKAVRHHGLFMDGWTWSTASLCWAWSTHAYTYIRTPPFHPLTPIYTILRLPRLTVTVYPIENASLLPSMTDAHTPYETDQTTFTIPVIQVNGENVEVNETTEEYVSLLD